MKFKTIVLGLLVAWSTSGVAAVDVDDAVIVSSISAVVLGGGGAIVVTADDVTLRERRGVDYSLGKMAVQIVAGPQPACLNIALAAAQKGRFVLRVRENAFTAVKSLTVRDKLVVNASDLKSCSWSR